MTTAPFVSDEDIARATTLHPISDIAAQLDIPSCALMPYGSYKAKIDTAALSPKDARNGALVLVSAINPTPAGEGKTTVSIALADALHEQHVRVALALREPSLGPVFGMKGGAAGGGHAQIAPMDDINLHFTGDFHAIESANNLLSAAIDNHIHQGNALGIDPRRVVWRRCMDVNDRQLRHIITGLGGATSGTPREEGFDITAASEVMAVFCLATDMRDLRARLDNMLVAYTYTKKPVFAKDLQVTGAMCALLRDALRPNLVQTLFHTPAFVHGGPFANIAHGCNTLIATRAALTCADIAITEAGFGADLGCEKFIDIVAPQLGRMPSCVVLVATLKALKYHGGCDASSWNAPNMDALKAGFANLKHHIETITTKATLPCVVALNVYATDKEDELAWVEQACAELGVRALPVTSWADGPKGARALASAVQQLVDAKHVGSDVAAHTLYNQTDSICAKIERIATAWYGADAVEYTPAARTQIKDIEAAISRPLGVCIAKTQYSISDDPHKLGAASHTVLHVREVRVSAGAGFVVVACARTMTMPGLGKHPAFESIYVDESNTIRGIF